MLAAIEQVKANMGAAPVLRAIQQNKTLVDFAPVLGAFRSQLYRIRSAHIEWILPLSQ